MTTFGIPGMVFQCVFEGSLSMQDTEIERRPYHKNCNCALHKSKGGACSSACAEKTVSFPRKQSWPDSSLCMSAATSKLPSQHCLPETEKMGMECIPCHIDNKKRPSRTIYAVIGDSEEKRLGTEKQF